jgi:toxin CptA
MSLLEMFTVLAPVAFIVGFALQRGNVCSVLAARQIVWSGRWSRLRGLLLASVCGFVVLMPFVWLGIGPFKLSPQVIPGPITVAGGVLYAFGCYVFGACIFGVCSRAPSGHISFYFAIPAMAVGATLGQHSGIAPTRADMVPTMMVSPGGWVMVLWAAGLVWLVWAAIRMIAAHRRAGITLSGLLSQSRWRSSLAAMMIGLLGSLLFATNAAWFYPAAAKRLTLYIANLSTTFPADSLIGAGAVFLGAYAAAYYKGRVAMRRPYLIPTFQAVVGGFIVGFAWSLIPGGNDSMVLYMLPSLALNGIVAYAAMFVTLIALEYMKKRFGWR